MKRIIVLVLALLPTACELHRDDVCDGSISTFISAGVVEGPTEVPVTGPLKVRGTVSADIYVETLRVAGELAKSTSGNFAEWEVTLSEEVLNAKRGEDGRAHIELSATDVCGNRRRELGQFSVPLALATTQVKELVLAEPVLASTSTCTLPIGGSARLTASADPTSAGASVTFVVAPASGAALLPSSGVVRLDADSRATATFLAERAGRYLVFVEAPGEVADTPAQIAVVGAPVFEPAGPVGVTRGAMAQAFVRSGAEIATCTAYATAPQTTSASVRGSDVLGQDVDVRRPRRDCRVDDVAAIEVSFAGAAPEGAQVAVVCFDVHGQRGAVTFEAR